MTDDLFFIPVEPPHLFKCAECGEHFTTRYDGDKIVVDAHVHYRAFMVTGIADDDQTPAAASGDHRGGDRADVDRHDEVSRG